MLTSMNELPNSTYEVKKELIQFTMEYIKIYAFPNECILYRKQYENASQYTECGISRQNLTINVNEPKVGVPIKAL